MFLIAWCLSTCINTSESDPDLLFLSNHELKKPAMAIASRVAAAAAFDISHMACKCSACSELWWW